MSVNGMLKIARQMRLLFAKRYRPQDASQGTAAGALELGSVCVGCKLLRQIRLLAYQRYD